MSSTTKIFAGALFVILGLVIIGSLIYLGKGEIGEWVGEEKRIPSEVGTPLNNPEPSSGKQIYRLEVDGVQREFIVYRPENIELDQKIPVVFMFHGGGQTAEYMYKNSGWSQKSEDEGFMVVYPLALKYHTFAEEKVENGQVVQNLAEYETRWSGYNFEQSFDPAYPDQVVHDDVIFVREAVEFIKLSYAVDASRFYATGFSSGGGMTIRLIKEATDIFASFAPSSSGILSPEALEVMIETTPNDFIPRSVIQTIGSTDPKLTYRVGIEEFSLTERAAQAGDPVHDSIIAPLLDALDLSDTYKYEKRGKVSMFFYGPEHDTNYQLNIVDDMGHIYPNGKNNRLIVADLYWSFFEQYSL